MRRDYDKLVRVPPELSAEMSRTAAIAEPVWQEARKASDWSMFQPYLEKVIELRRRYVDCFEPADEDYDILLDDYEPGMKTAEVRAVFDELKAGPRPAHRRGRRARRRRRRLVPRPATSRSTRRSASRARSSPTSASPPTRGGSTRPCIRSPSRSGIDDIRLTTKHHEDNLSSIFSSMHEFGHGIYEYGVDRAFARTPLARGTSLGFHESQSRMWENLVGRSRPFWQHYFPLVQEAFPAQLSGVDAEGFYRAANRVQPSLIRIEADEATYNLHIILRFELEQEMITGRLAAADVPEAWDAKMMEYLGVEVPDVADGALQDTHWAGGVDRLLLDLRARQRRLRAALGADLRGDPGRLRADRPRRVRAAARVAPRARPPARAEVHAAGAARADRRAPASTRSRCSRTFGAKLGEIYELDS